MRTERVVLAIVHNVTAATRLFDTLPLFAGDPRVRVVFTITGSSAFDRDTATFLDARGVTRIDWATARRTRFDLAVSASYGGDLHTISAPLFVIPHGMGYNKFLNKRTKEQKNKRTKEQKNSVFGLSPEWLVHRGRIVPSTIVLSHPEQRTRLLDTLPAAADRTLVAGDLCLDQLETALALRPSIRRAFGIAADQIFVVISSTWGPESLLARHPDLPADIAESAPCDEFRFAVAPHPNIVSEHSSWQFGNYLASAARAGAHPTDDVDGWKAAVVAADIVVGDQGSVSYYAAALGIPVLLATAPAHTVDPASPIAEFLRRTPLLDRDSDLPTQLRSVHAAHDAAVSTLLRAAATSLPGESADVLRAAFYRTLDLPEPPEAAHPGAVALPSTPLAHPDSHLVVVESTAPGTATITRYPAERLRIAHRRPRGAHLAVHAAGDQHRWLRLADLLVGAAGPDTARWITDSLTALPGCLLATAPIARGQWLLGDGTTTLTVHGSDRACPLFASVARHRLTRGDRLADLTGDWTLHCGRTSHRVTVTSAP